MFHLFTHSLVCAFITIQLVVVSKRRCFSATSLTSPMSQGVHQMRAHVSTPWQNYVHSWKLLEFRKPKQPSLVIDTCRVTCPHKHRALRTTSYSLVSSICSFIQWDSQIITTPDQSKCARNIHSQMVLQTCGALVCMMQQRPKGTINTMQDHSTTVEGRVISLCYKSTGSGNMHRSGKECYICNIKPNP